MIVIRAIVPAALVLLLSMSAAAQGPSADDQAARASFPSFGPTMMRVVPYPDEAYPPSETAPGFPHACYRARRCSAYDLYYFRDRPNRLARLAPEAPAEGAELPPLFQYLWVFVPVTPEQNILPEYRTASQVRDEFRAVGSWHEDAN